MALSAPAASVQRCVAVPPGYFGFAKQFGQLSVRAICLYRTPATGFILTRQKTHWKEAPPVGGKSPGQGESFDVKIHGLWPSYASIACDPCGHRGSDAFLWPRVPPVALMFWPLLPPLGPRASCNPCESCGHYCMAHWPSVATVGPFWPLLLPMASTLVNLWPETKPA